MKNHLNKLTKWVVVGVLAIIGAVIQNVDSAMAEGYGLTMSPMSQKIVLNPGDSLNSSFKISNPSSSTQDTYYKIEIEPFYKNEKNEVEYVAEGDSGNIVSWTTVNIPIEGKLAPNETKDVTFTIDVPESAPGGGQYMSILVTASAKPGGDEDVESDSGATVKEVKKMSHLIYAEVSGNTVRNGEIKDANLPSFLLSGKITGSATVYNAGNVHGDAKYTLKVYPLFSDEEIYTNEENPATFLVLPKREVYSEVSWEQTPPIGIFNAVFTVGFEGDNDAIEISKLIIICPVWLLFIIFFVLAGIIIWIVMRVRGRGQEKPEEA